METTKEKYQQKLNIINHEIDGIEEYIKFNKRTNKVILYTGIVFLLILIITNFIIDKVINTLDVISVSLIITNLYHSVFDYFKFKSESRRILFKLKVERDRLEKAISELEEETEVL